MPAPTGQLQRTSQAYDAESDFFTPRATISATTLTTGFAFPMVPQGEYKAQVFSAAYTGFTAGTVEWQAEVQVSDTQAGTYSAVAKTTLRGDGGAFDIALSGRMIQQVAPNAGWVRLNMIRVGAPGNLSYEASIVPC